MKPKSYRKKASGRTLKAPVPADPRPARVVQQVLADLPELLAVAVVEVATGTSLAAHTTTPNFDPATAAAYNAEVVKHKLKALTALQLGNEAIEDILITLSSQLHLLRLTGNGGQFIYLVVDSATTNLGIARAVLRSQVEQLELASV